MKRNVNVLGKSLPVIPLLMMLSVVGVAIAGMMASYNVPITMRIVGLWEITVYDEGGIAELSAIAIGDLHRGDEVEYPSNSPINYYFVKNTADYNVYLCYDLTGFPADVNFQLYYRVHGISETWALLGKNEMIQGSFSQSGAYWVEFYIEIDVPESAGVGSYSPQLTWEAHEAQGG